MKLYLTSIILALDLVTGAVLVTGTASAAADNGRAGAMPAYYDDELFTINLMELSDTSAEAVIDHNTALNAIFVSDDPLPDGEPFISVIDAIQGDGFNPLWLEIEIHFAPGHTPRQLTSDTEIEEAAANGEIVLEATDEVYRCSVIGPKQ